MTFRASATAKYTASRAKVKRRKVDDRPRFAAPPRKGALHVALANTMAKHGEEGIFLALALVAHHARKLRPDVAEVLDAFRYVEAPEALVDAARKLRGQERADTKLARAILERLPKKIERIDSLAIVEDRERFELSDVTVIARKSVDAYYAANVALGFVERFKGQQVKESGETLFVSHPLALDFSRRQAFVEKVVARLIKDASADTIEPERIAEDALVTLAGFSLKRARDAVSKSGA